MAGPIRGNVGQSEGQTVAQGLRAAVASETRPLAGSGWGSEGQKAFDTVLGCCIVLAPRMAT